MHVWGWNITLRVVFIHGHFQSCWSGHFDIAEIDCAIRFVQSICSAFCPMYEDRSSDLHGVKIMFRDYQGLPFLRAVSSGLRSVEE